MKTIRLISLSQNDKDIYEKIKIKKSAIFEYANGKTLLKTNGNIERYEIRYINLKIDKYIFDSLALNILKIIKHSHYIVETVGKVKRPQEDFNFVPEYSDYGRYDEYDILLNDIKKWLYYLDITGQLDVLNICCWIPFKLLTNRHIWANGNKRTALTTCINLLKLFKLYLSYSDYSGLTDDGKDRWYDIFTKYVRDDDNPDQCVELNRDGYYQIYKKFYKDILIAIYFNIYAIKEQNNG